MISALWAIVKLAFRALIVFWRILRSLWRIIITFAVVILISLNVATLTITSVNAFLSNVVDFVVEGASLRQRETKQTKKLNADLESSNSRRRAIQNSLANEQAANRRAQRELSELRPRLASLTDENVAVRRQTALLRDNVENVTDRVTFQ